MTCKVFYFLDPYATPVVVEGDYIINPNQFLKLQKFILSFKLKFFALAFRYTFVLSE